jgi:hypothetical protein
MRTTRSWFRGTALEHSVLIANPQPAVAVQSEDTDLNAVDARVCIVEKGRCDGRVSALELEAGTA